MKYETYVEYRDKKGLIDHNIARELGIPKSTFSGWKHGAYTPKTDKLIKIAKMLDIPSKCILEPDVTKEQRRKEHEKDKDKDSG